LSHAAEAAHQAVDDLCGQEDWISHQSGKQAFEAGEMLRTSDLQSLLGDTKEFCAATDSFCRGGDGSWLPVPGLT